MKLLALTPLCVLALIAGCVRHDRLITINEAGPARPSFTTQPILYHRTGGIAGTDDRVVIWPDGVVLVSGKLLNDAKASVPADRIDGLRKMFAGWDRLSGSYLATPAIDDAYNISISYGGKTIEASDLATNLPEQFRRIFTEIESIAAQAAAEAKPAP